jgi:predicted O-methyltransferase YrrM
MSVNLSNALQIQGFTSPAELEWLAMQASTRKSIAEIGSWKGRSTRAMADNTTGNIYAIDTWAGTPEDAHFKELQDKPKDWLRSVFYVNVGYLPNVVTKQYRSLEAAARCCHLKTFDMIFIDAAHDYESVKADILAWRPLLKDGGLLCGHDYDRGRPGVVQAVRELIPDRVGPVGSIWAAR